MAGDARMKSTEFLENDMEQGQALEWSEEEWSQIVNMIQQDCQPYLQQAKGLPLYRGMYADEKAIFNKKARMGNREPMNLPKDVHTKLNQLFLFKHGARFRNALFATGSDTEASMYGVTYHIFPIGEFKFLWSPKVNDLYLKWGAIKIDNTGKTDQEVKQEKLQVFHDTALKTHYTTNNLTRAIKSQHEIMMRVNSYHAIRTSSFESLPKEWQDMLK